ncbi:MULTISPECIES: hypothetical protein [unclassified Nonomuraea]|uniref:alpha/beta fold hydrolase n=1 Tax=unclassified Nonomuraea TaxID=2593643 RepID=UPI00340A6E01
MAWDAEQIANPPSTREEHVESQLKLARILAGRLTAFDEAATRAIIEREIENATDAGHASKNHILAAFASRDRSGLVGSITAPTLVIHGSDDPMAPFAHGEALAAAIPGSEFLPVGGMARVPAANHSSDLRRDPPAHRAMADNRRSRRAARVRQAVHPRRSTPALLDAAFRSSCSAGRHARFAGRRKALGEAGPG